MEDPKSLTLEEIGRRAGVSRSTVSRVLNDQPEVRPDVRARVEAVIAETGYSPNPAARALVSRRSGLIGLVMLTDADGLFGDPYYSSLVSGIQQGCERHGLIFSIFPVEGKNGRSDVLTTQIAQGFVDAVIVTAAPQSDRIIEALRRRNTRVVVVGRPGIDVDVLRVDVDNHAGSRTAVAHLVEHGRSRIAYIGPTEEFTYGQDRLAGYRDALAAAGRDVDEQLIRLDEPTAAGGYRAAQSLLATRFDAIHAATDSMAEGAVRALADHDVSVPDDVAIVGFDGLPRSPELTPSLTTIVQPVAKVGRTAVDLVTDETADTGLTTLPTTLRLGGSCGHDPADAEPADSDIAV